MTRFRRTAKHAMALLVGAAGLAYIWRRGREWMGWPQDEQILATVAMASILAFIGWVIWDARRNSP